MFSSPQMYININLRFFSLEQKQGSALFGNQDKICSEKKAYFSQQTIIFTLIN